MTGIAREESHDWMVLGLVLKSDIDTGPYKVNFQWSGLSSVETDHTMTIALLGYARCT